MMERHLSVGVYADLAGWLVGMDAPLRRSNSIVGRLTLTLDASPNVAFPAHGEKADFGDKILGLR